MTSFVKIEKAVLKDAEVLHNIQILAFEESEAKYGSSPATHPLSKTMERISTGYYEKILYKEEVVGGIYAHPVTESVGTYQLHIIYLLPKIQGLGIAQSAIQLVEVQYPDANKWVLDVVESETRNRHLYEKLGYQPTNRKEQLKNVTLLFYEKLV